MSDTGSVDTRRVVASAREEARRLGHRRVGTEHLLLALLGEDGSTVAGLLVDAGCTLSAARHMVVEIATATAGDGDSELTPRAERALNRANRFARQERAGEVAARHVLLGVLDVEGLACQVLRRLGVDLAQLRRDAAGTPIADPSAVGERPTIGDGAVDRDAEATESPRAAVTPTCSGCGMALTRALVVSTLDAVDESGRPTEVRIVHCGSCGTTIGVAG